MLDPLIDLLNSKTPLYPPLGRLVVIAFLFALAWLVARSSGWVALRVLDWHDRRQSSDVEATGKIANLKRRETLVSMIRAGIIYLAFGAAIVLSIAQLTGGVDRLTAIAGASFLIIVAGFATQRILVDILAGLTMFAERWFSVGDTVTVHAGVELQGVVEDVSLRRTRLRSVTGEVIHIHNSQITAVQVLPRGVKELAIELFVSKREEGERLVADVASILPEGPTTFVRRPWIEQIDELSHNLTRIRVRTTIAPGREWLAEGFFADLLKEQAGDSLIVHGPVTLAVDERATWSFARASGATRGTFARGRRSPVGVP
jgi:moderate conductance mechanosensitive channel